MNLSNLQPAPQEILDFISVNSRDLQKPAQPKHNSNLKKNQSLSNDDLKDMLDYLDADMSYQDWLNVGMALHDYGADFSLWDNWSKQGSKYKTGECLSKWQGFSHGNGITIATFVKMAKDQGYAGRFIGCDRNVKDSLPISNTSKNNRAGFGFIHISELIKEIKPINWLIKDHIERHSLSLIFGDPASGKSFVAIDMACCIATGLEWHGDRVEQGAVFYIAGEGHNGLTRRFKAWEVHHECDLSQAPLYISYRPAQFYDEQSAQEVIDEVQALADKHQINPSFIIVDTLARNFGGGDENSTKDMGIFVQNIDRLKDTWRASVLIVHHTGHQEKQRARGSIALKGALDHEYGVHKIADGVFTFKNSKMKDSTPPKEKGFEITPIELEYKDEDGNPLNGAIIKPNNALLKQAKSKASLKGQALIVYRYICDCITDKGQERQVKSLMPKVISITMDECREYLKENGADFCDSDKPDNINRAIKRQINKLIELNYLRLHGEYIWLTDNSDKDGQTEN